MARAVDASPLAAAYRACQQITRSRAGNFYFAFLPLPKRQRQAIYAVYAFSRACDDYADAALPLSEKQELLALQRQRLHNCFNGNPDGVLFPALADTARRYRIPQAYFDALIDGVLMDLTVRRYQTFEELRGYCYHVASVVGLICIEVFGYSNPKAKDHAVDLGIAMQLVNIMRDVREDAERDRIYLPRDEMQRFGYTEEDLRQGVMNRQFAELMGSQAQRARQYFDQGQKLLPLMPLRSRVCPAILQGLYSKLLQRMEAQGYNVFGGRTRLGTHEKLWLATRIWTATTLGGLGRRDRPSS